MKLLRVTNIQRGCVFDGPGVRTTVFLKGCTLRCPWCCNPETISQKEEWFVDDTKCLFTNGISSEICKACVRIGGVKPITACPFGVTEPTSSDYSVDELYESILRDENLYRVSGGGVTFSGGEPLLQAVGLSPLLERLKEKDINIAFETTLVAPPDCLGIIKNNIDLFIIDVKLQPQMFLNSQNYIIKLLNNLDVLRNYNTIFRMVYVDEVWTNRQEVTENLLKLGILELELLICHNLGSSKYKKLSLESLDYTSDIANAELFVSFLSENGIRSTILSA